jgi:tRNA G46 methylase TrmB
VEEVTRDLHVAKAPSEYVTTEYEDKFSAAGKSINFMRLKKA